MVGGEEQLRISCHSQSMTLGEARTLTLSDVHNPASYLISIRNMRSHRCLFCLLPSQNRPQMDRCNGSSVIPANSLASILFPVARNPNYIRDRSRGIWSEVTPKLTFPHQIARGGRLAGCSRHRPPSGIRGKDGHDTMGLYGSSTALMVAAAVAMSTQNGTDRGKPSRAWQ